MILYFIFLSRVSVYSCTVRGFQELAWQTEKQRTVEAWHIPAVKVHLGYYWILCCHEHKNVLAIKTIIGLTNSTERDQVFCNRYSCRSLYQRRNKWHLTLYTILPSDLEEMTGLNIYRGSDVTWEHVYLVAGDSADCKHSHRNDATIVPRCKKTLLAKWTAHTCKFKVKYIERIWYEIISLKSVDRW